MFKAYAVEEEYFFHTNYDVLHGYPDYSEIKENPRAEKDKTTVSSIPAKREENSYLECRVMVLLAITCSNKLYHFLS